MPISFKHINTLDSDQIKLDNVNYNFDQLVANGGGPRGNQGSIGQTGPQGTTGPQGFNGPIGIPGDQGTDPIININYWDKIDAVPSGIDAITLVPLHTLADQFAPVVNIGYLDTDSDYTSKQPLVEGKTPYQWAISRKPYMPSNLRFKNREISDNGYDFKLEKVGDLDQLTMGFSKYTVENSNISDIIAYKTIFKSDDGNIDSFNISSELAEFNVKTEFNLPVDIKRNLIIQNADATNGSVAVAENDDGLIKFKRIDLLKGTVPFGTIVSMSTTVFTGTSNFVSNEVVVGSDSTPIEITVGKGLGIYSGWYLCNGKEWTNGSGISYQVPMLGKFNYSIQDNPFSILPNSQGTAITNNTSTHIIGGSNIDAVSSFDFNQSTGSRTYTVTGTVSMGDSLTNLSCGLNPDSGTTFLIKQLPQIIYLGRDDLYWFDKGTGQDPPILLQFLLDDGNITPSKLSPNPYSLGIINDQPALSSYSRSFPVWAPNGYYWSTLPGVGDITGVPGYATLNSITSNGDPKPTIINILIDIDSHPEDPEEILLNINTTEFITLSTTSISLVRTNPDNVTCITPTTLPIQYNFETGYTFQLTYLSVEGYEFNTTPISSITQPASGGGTVTVISSSLSNQNKTLIINLKLDGIPLIGYLTTIEYSINAVLFPTVVTIGTQKWTVRNLDVVKYRSGIPIPEWTGDDAGWNLLTTGAWCYPVGNPANGPIYGKLYNGYAVGGIIQQDTRIANQDIAPEGYYVPSRAEWNTLNSVTNGIPPSGNPGGKLKAIGTIEDGDGLWKEPNTGANNITGFTALPAGFRENNSISMKTGITANWWSKDFYNFQLSYNSITMSSVLSTKRNGYAVRLLKDSKPVQIIGFSCGTSMNSIGLNVREWKILLDPLGGTLLFVFHPSSAPDKMEILHNEVRKATTSMLANSNSGPFDTYYGNYMNNIPSSPHYIDQFIGTATGAAGKNFVPPPSRKLELLAATGIDQTISAGYEQFVWWKYTANDYIINNYAIARGVSGSPGSGWWLERRCT
jgi:uncharacterized protein (TIGR02145 family)